MSNQAFENHNEHQDELLGMIHDLIGQANSNYLRTLIASSKRDGDEVWQRYHESFSLDEDINTLTILHVMSTVSTNNHRFMASQ